MAERYDEVVNADGTISYKQAEGTKSIGGWNFIGYEPSSWHGPKPVAKVCVPKLLS